MEQIGRYRILKRLGGGGFGEVFLGEDAQIDRLVAIKVFRPKDENLIAFATSSDEEGLRVLRERFVHEARILAGLESSPNIVNVFDFGELEDGAPYYVMAYVPRSLSDAIGRDVFDAAALQALPEAERPRALEYGTALDIFGQTLEGMAAAHARGLVHRDIKPPNILLTDDNQVRVADFGIAKAPDGQHSTVSHLGLGSRNYMAPEQRESAKHVDARADVYALGVLAYRLFTGRLPTGRYADPDVHQPRLAAGLNQLILDCLQENRDDRPADAGAVLARFRTARNQAPQASDENATGTGVTLAGRATPGVRSELAPLVARIESLLFELGEVPTSELEALEPLAAIADLGTTELDALIAQVADQHEAKLRPLRSFLATIRARVATGQGALSTTDRSALHDAGESLGWAPAQVDVAIGRAQDALERSESADAAGDSSDRGKRQNPSAVHSRQRSFRAHRPPLKWPRFALAGLILAAVGGALWWWPSFDISPASQATTRSSGESVTARDASVTHGSRILGGGSGLLVVRTEPPGARVTIDGEDLGTTPVDLSDLRAGTYTVELDHPRFRVEQLEGQTIADHRVTRIDASLTPASGSVTVLSEPSAAWVERSGERVAEETPVTLEGLPVGRHQLRLGATEHHPRDVEVEITRGEVTVTDSIVLESITYGTLTLELEPADAEVVLPDITPRYQRGMRLEDGEYTVRVSARHHEPRTLQVAVSGDTVERVALKPYGSLTLTTVPEDVQVRLRGGHGDYTPGMRLPDGNYQVELSAAGHDPRTTSVRVEGATRERIELAQRFGTLTVETDPADARITLPDLDVSYSSGMRVPEGRHQLRVEREGYQPRQVESHVEGATRATVRLFRTRHPGEEFTDRLASGGEGPRMVVMPAGEFVMGSPTSERGRSFDGGAQRTVRIEQPFALGRTPVTFAEYDRFVTATGHRRPGDQGWGRGDRPVIHLDWDDAKAYVEWLSAQTDRRYRLPSEAEWEYAARGGTTTSRWWGDGISCAQANHQEPVTQRPFIPDRRNHCVGDGQTVPVGRYGPNPFGLYDVLGNVSEWMQDCWNVDYNGGPVDGSAWTRSDCGSRVVRGGSYIDSPNALRAAARLQVRSSNRSSRMGFRVAMDL